MTSGNGTDETSGQRKTDVDHLMDAMMEMRIHILAMLSTMDRLLWFMKVEHPKPFDQDSADPSQEIQPL